MFMNSVIRVLRLRSTDWKSSFNVVPPSSLKSSESSLNKELKTTATAVRVYRLNGTGEDTPKTRTGDWAWEVVFLCQQGIMGTLLINMAVEPKEVCLIVLLLFVRS